jgi:lysophospholipase L1-like esterase
VIAAFPGIALAAGNALTTTSTAYDFAGSKFAGGALSGGYGTIVVTAPATNSFTWEAWVKLGAAPGQPIVAIGSAAAGYLGANAAGQEICNIAAGNTTITGPSLLDGNWHLMDLVGSASGLACFLDGALIGSNATSQTVAANTTIGVGTMGLYPGNNVWSGEIDEASIWSVARYAGAFTPPVAPYLGSETGLSALWHLNGNGLDSAGDLVVSPNNAAMLFSPFNWATSGGMAVTINAGAYMRMMFTGTSCALNFDLSGSLAPASQIYWRVDGYEAGQPWVRTTAAANIPCSPPTELAAAPWHQLELVVKSTSETINRWNPAAPGTTVRLAGVTLATGASVQRPFAAPWTILVFGDSITEGVRTVNQTAPLDTDRNNATLGWAYLLKERLGAEVGVVGFGATGFTTAGSGGVPALTASWSQAENGLARTPGVSPNLIVINEGTNDIADVTTAAITVLNGLIAQYPATPIALLVPFDQAHANELTAAAQRCNQPGLVHLVPTNGMLNPANGIDQLGLHPTGPNNLGFVAPRLASMLMPILVGGANGLTPPELARIP